MPKTIKQHVDITATQKATNWLQAAINLYNNNLDSREDHIDFRILSTEELANRVAAELNNAKLQSLPEAQTLMNRRAAGSRRW